MKNILNIVFGFICLSNVIYHLIKCPMCDERFFGMTIPGIAYLAIWATLGFIFFQRVYKDNVQKKED